MRHLIILDLRAQDAYDESHIRKAIRCQDEPAWVSQLTASLLANRDDRFRSHYTNDDMTRVLFVVPADRASELEREINAKLSNFNR